MIYPVRCHDTGGQGRGRHSRPLPIFDQQLSLLSIIITGYFIIILVPNQTKINVTVNVQQYCADKLKI